MPKEWRARAARNQKEQCVILGCFKNRTGLANYCAKHKKRIVQYGHPEGRTIHKMWYKREKEEVSKLIAVNIDEHVQLNSCIDAVHRLLLCPYGHFPKDLTAMQIQRIKEAGVTAEDIVTEVAAVWLFAERYPGMLPLDERLTYQIGRSVLKLASTFKFKWRDSGSNCVTNEYDRYTGQDCRDIGRLLRQMLGMLSVSIAAHIVYEEEKAIGKEKEEPELFKSIYNEGA